MDIERLTRRRGKIFKAGIRIGLETTGYDAYSKAIICAGLNGRELETLRFGFNKARSAVAKAKKAVDENKNADYRLGYDDLMSGHDPTNWDYEKLSVEYWCGYSAAEEERERANAFRFAKRFFP